MWSLQIFVVIFFITNSFVLQGPQFPPGVGAAPLEQENRVSFHVYSADSNTTGESAANYTLGEDILPNYPLTLIIHGFTGNYLTKSSAIIRDALLYKGLKNIVSVDWESLASIPNASPTVSYYQIVEDNVPLVADVVTSWLKSLNERGVIDYSEVHIIGFSLGAQIAGLVGSQLEGEIGRITALDPPKIGYAEKPIEHKLDSTDAKFVFVIHTSGGFISFAEPCGHVDFYPNGGSPPQPECPMDDMIHSMACSHYMAYKIFTESVYNEFAFNASTCENWSSFKENKCNSNEYALMGYITSNKTRGNFYFKTNLKPPFGLTVDGKTLPNSVIKQMMYTEEDRRDVTSSFSDSEKDEKDQNIAEIPGETNAARDKYNIEENNIMRVKSKHHSLPSTTSTPLVKQVNSSHHSYHSYLLVVISCVFSIRYFRL